MKNLRLGFGMMAALVALSGCAVPDWKISGRITRYTTIDDHRFKPDKLNVPANTPFWFAVDGVDEVNGLTVSSPDLNIPRRAIRAHVHDTQWLESHAPVRTRLGVDALQPGSYEFMCECHGKPATLTITAIPEKTP